MPNEHDFALEKRLNKLDKNLHKRFTSMVFSMPYILANYKKVFPQYTDHAVVHSLNIIDFCNQIIGDQIDKLNADEVYVILLACYLHDTGMGISYNDYPEFTKQIDFKDYFESHSDKDIPTIIRSFHHEYSGLFIKKYASFLEIPSKEHIFAIAQVARGHRKLNLEDKNEFPIDYKVPNGNTICLPYLASLVRLADEIDVTAARNILIDFDYHKLKDEIDLIEFMKHEAIKNLIIEEKEFILEIESDDEKVLHHLEVAVNKMRKTLEECRHAVNDVTPYTITQERIVVRRIDTKQ